MHKIIAALLLALSVTQASAHDCPAFFRFVDFGLTNAKGEVYRGGTLLRAEGLDGRALLLRDQTQCLGISDVAKDGRGNPIPVVTGVQYDPAKTVTSLKHLSVTAVVDAIALAEESADAHRAVLATEGTQIVRTEEFMCAVHSQIGSLSCQLKSPYAGNAPLVINCEEGLCDVPALAINAQLVIRATWDVDGALNNDPKAMGEDALVKISNIHAFLDPLSAAF